MATEDLQGYSVWHLAAEVNDVEALQMIGGFSVHDDHSYPSDFQPNNFFTRATQYRVVSKIWRLFPRILTIS